jgi:DNA-directed RNA polymerase III subunit RPC3
VPQKSQYLAGSNASQRVFSVLARFGRQRLADVARFSYLNRRQISSALVILVQQHLIARTTPDPAEPDQPTFYEIDWQHSYALVRCGRVVKLVQDRFDLRTANVVSNLLTLGHTRIADLTDAYFPPDTDSDAGSDDGVVNGVGLKRKRNGAPVNGTNGKVNGTGAHVNGDGASTGADSTHTNGAKKEDDGSIHSVDSLYEIIHNLMKKGWLIKVEESQYLSAGDFHQMCRQEAIKKVCKGPIPEGKKEIAQVASSTQREKRRVRDAWLEPPQCLELVCHAKSSSHKMNNKRLKINGGNDWSRSANGDPASEVAELVIRVNPGKIAVAMRTEQLVDLVEQRLGDVTADIYRIMLESLEDRIGHCFEEWPSPPPPHGGEDDGDGVRENEHLRIYSEYVARSTSHLDICEGLDPSAVCSITGRFMVQDKETGQWHINVPLDPSKLTVHQRKQLVEKHIDLLTHDPFHFATWVGRDEYRIDFEEIAKTLIQHQLENTISARKMPLGVKLIRALQRKGKLDERQTCSAMMMSATDIRGVINDLTVQGFVQTQEIPKVDRREAKHSLHLIWYDRQRAREKLLHDTYKGMVRIMQRLAYEREKVQPLLAKAERSDVVGNEDKYLSKDELDALKKWKEVQEKLLLQLFREDDLVATLRDFVGPLISA